VGKDQAEISVKLDNGRVYPHSGTLQFSEVSVEESTGAVTLRAIVPNPDGVLLPGMFVRNGLQTGDRVIVDGVQKVQPGMQVKPVPAAETASAVDHSAKSAAPTSGK